jgi:hypothetical protein
MATAAAVGLMVALPVGSFFLAPSAHADNTPGANLAGLNATAYASGTQIAPLTPGVVGAGNVSQGNLVEGAVPYAAASMSTGPSSTAVASPAYPGDTAAGAGNAIGTFAPQFPSTLTNALNYPVLAKADYPPQLNTGSSSKYNPPGTGGTGVGTASASATDSGSTCQSSTASQSFGSSAGVQVGSSSASSSTVLTASSVAAASHTDVGTITLLAGAIKIGGVTSDASATSDGSNGHETSAFAIGAVTVAGQPASIGPNGITLKGSGTGQGLIPDANQVLVALQQAGISVHTIAPSSTNNGAQASVTSGGLVITFIDPNIPNPNGQIPVSSLGFDLNIGISQASADATSLPPFDIQTGSVSPSLGSGTPAPASVGPSTASVAPATGGSVATGPVSNGSVSAGTVPAGTSSGSTAPAYSPPETLLGAPIKVAWVVIAFLLSLVASGPLLGYANWQLLRGRKS